MLHDLLECLRSDTNKALLVDVGQPEDSIVVANEQELLVAALLCSVFVDNHFLETTRCSPQRSVLVAGEAEEVGLDLALLLRPLSKESLQSGDGDLGLSEAEVKEGNSLHGEESLVGQFRGKNALVEVECEEGREFLHKVIVEEAV